MASKLTLIVMPGCPFCTRVLRFMDKNNIDIEVKRTSDPGVAEELVEKGGKYQAPCLFIDEEPLYESLDIIAYLEKEFVS